ncbi:response regulator transcription factor [Rhizobium ruizarguesonis]
MAAASGLTKTTVFAEPHCRAGQHCNTQSFPRNYASNKTSALLVTKTVVSAPGTSGRGCVRAMCLVAFRMRSKKGFVHASRELLDRWISGGGAKLPEELYQPALHLFTASMVLCLQRDGRSLIVHGYSAQAEQSTTVDEFACGWLASRHHEIQKQARPVSTGELIETKGNHVAFDTLLLPQKGGGWSLAAFDIQLMLPVPRINLQMDGVDHSILQLLYRGLSVKEIAQQVELSHRTIEHRTERLKARLGARTLPQLVALSIANGLSGKGSRFL